MAGLKEIKARIGGAKSARKMTRAMKLVSAARLRSAQARTLNLRGYAAALRAAVRDVAMSQRISHPFLEPKRKREIKKALFAVMTSDRGLCGGFNGNICRYAEKILEKKEHAVQDLFFVGRKGADYFRFRGISGQGTLLNLTREISYPLAARIAHDLMEKISSGDYDGVFVIYNEFKSALSPRIVCERLLPFDMFNAGGGRGSEGAEEAAEGPEAFAETEEEGEEGEAAASRDILFEVPPEELIKSLLDRHFSIQIYRCFCENVAAEHGARMTAMESAANNAEEAIEKLTLKYNKKRQSAITTELTEIAAGAEALK